MAQRYGGKYSPESSDDRPKADARDQTVPFTGKRTRAGARSHFLFLAPLPLVFSIFGGGPVSMAFHLSALGLLLLGAWLTREGLLAEEAYDARRVAKRPAIPRKMFGNVAIGLGLTLGSYMTSGLLGAALIGVAGCALHVLAFGPDPMRDKGSKGIDRIQQDRVAKAVDTAEAHLTGMSDAIAGLQDRALDRRVQSFQSTARKMFRTVEEDPRDLTAARKFLGVYLKGAQDAATKFARLYETTRDADARTDFFAFLDDLEGNFAAKTDKLLSDSRTEMDIEIKVLRDRLEREGLHVDQD